MFQKISLSIARNEMMIRQVVMRAKSFYKQNVENDSFSKILEEAQHSML